ncbi:unnamed protein product [Cylindrotheca closterium]|uniref:Uncharacterized protein n=1 Tax=Cylindrotheca closterium TaxID=2856 RepID=A0AAD2FBG5_9STRA|nr:unnamed protein product [Cylindrotheca closterium]
MMVKKRHGFFGLLFLFCSYATIPCRAYQPSSRKSWPSSVSVADTKKSFLDIRIKTSSSRCASVLQQRQSSLSFSPFARSLSNDDDFEISDGNKISPLGVVGIASQPIVWVSLGFVATTGAGLPAGPFGLLGAVEGLSYLIVVGLVASNVIFQERTSDSSLETAQKLSSFTLLAALLTLLSLVKDQGCIPNAKPILDYSNYLPVCSPEDTPGIFGA